MPLLRGKTSAFSGNTGVGKSSLLNALDPRLALKTGETSKKLGRGRHTTRHCELFRVGGGYVADTPGFSSLDFEKGKLYLKTSFSTALGNSDLISEIVNSQRALI